MDVSRLRRGELIAGGAGVLLFFDLWMHWYSAGGGKISTGVGQIEVPSVAVNAFKAFDFTDLLLVLLVIIAVGQAVLTATQRSVALPVAASVIVAGYGAFMTVLVLYRIINQPGPNDFVNVEIGAYIGLVLTAAVAYGGFLGMQEEGTSFSEAKDSLAGGSGHPPASPPPPPAAPPAAPPPPADPGGSAPPPGV
jgi:hypothetical protein